MGWFNRRPHFIPCIVSAIMSLIAVADLPYGYYILLRWVVTTTAIFTAFIAGKVGSYWAAWLYGIIALLFNPIIRIHLSKGLWQPIDILTAALLILAAFAVRRA